MSLAMTGFAPITQYLADVSFAKPLVVIDVDGVLTYPKSPIWQAHIRKVFDVMGRIKQLSEKHQEAVHSKIYSYGSISTDPKGAKDFFEFLRKKQIPHICLTSFRCPIYGLIENSHVYRHEELEKLGIDLRGSYHESSDDTLSDFGDPKLPIRFFKSIVFASTNKGEALRCFLEQTAPPHRFFPIIAIDDQLPNLDAIQWIFHQAVTIHYEAPRFTTSDPIPDAETVKQELEAIISECAQALGLEYEPPLPVIEFEAAL